MFLSISFIITYFLFGIISIVIYTKKEWKFVHSIMEIIGYVIVQLILLLGGLFSFITIMYYEYKDSMESKTETFVLKIFDFLTKQRINLYNSLEDQYEEYKRWKENNE